MNKKEKLEDYVLRCVCNSTEHTLIINEDSDEEFGIEINSAYIHIHLTKKSFWNRLKYLFGYQCTYGAFEEVIINKDNTKQLYEMLKRWHGRK